MGCKRCGSERVANIQGKCSDMCFVEIPGCKEHNGYVPDDMGIGGGDMLQIEMCLNCGQVQDTFPIPKTKIEEEPEKEEES